MTAAAPVGPALPQSLRPGTLLRRLAPLARFPVTGGLLAVLLLCAVVSHSLYRGPRAELLATVATGVGQPLSGLFTSAFWCADRWSYVTAGTLALVLLAPAERRLGSRGTAVAVLVAQVLGAAMGVLVIQGLAALGDRWAEGMADADVVGPFPGILGVAALATAYSPTLWRRRLRLVLSVALVALVLYSGTAGDVLRLTAWVLGLAAGRVVRHPGTAHPPSYATRHEGRTLAALVLAATALGPLLAALSRTHEGPWAVVSHLFVSTPPPRAVLREVCGPGGDPAYCRVLTARARLTGRGPTLLTVLPVLLQLTLAEGLRRGRRAAWGGAVLLTSILSVVGGLVVVAVHRNPMQQLRLLGAQPGSLPAVSLVAPLVAPLAVLALLLAYRNRFPVRAAPGALRRWLLTAAAGLAVIGTLYVTVGSLRHAEFEGSPSAVVLLLDLADRMLPPGWLGAVPPPLVPLAPAARTLAAWAGVAAWSVLLVTAVRLVRPVPPPGDAEQARALVQRQGWGPLAFMTTWAGNRYWFTADGRAFVAFRVLGGVALTTGDPIGEPEARRAAVREFAAWCAEHSWTPCWYSVTDEVLEALEGSGAQRLQVAAETWLPLGELAFTGRRWQDVRTALNRAQREGITAQWSTWSGTSLPLREQIAELSEEWLAGKGLPEMGFTLGGLDELTDDAVRLLLAVDADGQLRGLTSWLPAHRDGQRVGWTLDVMRRAGNAPPGIVEFLIGTAALTFQEEGAEWVSLSGAPLALPAGSADQRRLNRLLELAGRTMEPVYGFRSLLAFKAKFQPRHRALWLVYPSAADLPRIARAVSRAYLPDMTPAQAVRLGRQLLRGHRRRPRRALPSPREVA